MIILINRTYENVWNIVVVNQVFVGSLFFLISSIYRKAGVHESYFFFRF